MGHLHIQVIAINFLVSLYSLFGLAGGEFQRQLSRCRAGPDLLAPTKLALTSLPGRYHGVLCLSACRFWLQSVPIDGPRHTAASAVVQPFSPPAPAPAVTIAPVKGHGLSQVVLMLITMQLSALMMFR